jgi:hypothetical protein
MSKISSWKQSVLGSSGIASLVQQEPDCMGKGVTLGAADNTRFPYADYGTRVVLNLKKNSL